MLGTKNVAHKNLHEKKVKKKIRYNKFFGPRKIWVKRSFVQKNIGPQRLRPPQNWVPKVTAETLLIWTNVARTYVAQTNVTMTVDIC